MSGQACRGSGPGSAYHAAAAQPTQLLVPTPAPTTQHCPAQLPACLQPSARRLASVASTAVLRAMSAPPLLDIHNLRPRGSAGTIDRLMQRSNE